ncbi:MAG: transposase [Candidatus Nitrosocosmicus sp.]|nr:transposase [Candidatus Nitrosocosmicus sp.]MDN5868613.1 transposase [Candidatus Nitrosocosmicus sp.]
MTCIQKEEKGFDKKDNLWTISILDKLRDEIKNLLSKEKPNKTVGRPFVRYRKVFDGILDVLRTGLQ